MRPVTAYLAFVLLWTVVAVSVLPPEYLGQVLFAEVIVFGAIAFGAIQDRRQARRDPPRMIALSPRAARGRR